MAFLIRRKRGTISLGTAVAVLLVAFSVSAGEDLASGAPSAVPTAEYKVKLAFVYNFATFVNWPEGKSEPLCLAVLGESPFGPGLVSGLAGKSVRGRKIVVRQSKRPEDLDGCEVIFVAKSERERYAELIRRWGKQPVLTVGDEPAFTEVGGMLHLYVDRDRVRFAARRQAIEAAGLKVSSQLLALASEPGTF